MNVVDTSARLAFLDGDSNAAVFEDPISNDQDLIVPTIVITELTRRFLVRDDPEEKVERALALVARGRMVALTEELAAEAGHLGVAHRLPLADSIIYATARAFAAEVWTQDADFDGLPHVRYFARQP